MVLMRMAVKIQPMQQPPEDLPEAFLEQYWERKIPKVQDR